MPEDWASYLNYQDYKRLGSRSNRWPPLVTVLNLISDGEPGNPRRVRRSRSLTYWASNRFGRLFTRRRNRGQEAVVVIGWIVATPFRRR